MTTTTTTTSQIPQIEVHVETDWGGRTSGDLGITKGLPFILHVLRSAKVKAWFYISTELLRDYRLNIERVHREGHTLGVHGHFHIPMSQTFRQTQNVEISQGLLSQITGTRKNPCIPRKFDCSKCGYKSSICSPDTGTRIGLLKSVWFNQRLDTGKTVYVHPFDIVEHGMIGPSLFTTVWYSRWKEARRRFESLLNKSS